MQCWRIHNQIQPKKSMEIPGIEIRLTVLAAGYNLYERHILYSCVLYMESDMDLQLVNRSYPKSF